MAINPATGHESEPIASVFGGEKDTPHAFFQKSRTENAGAVTHHRPNDLALECPKCKNGVRLFSKEGVGYYCVAGHKWLDYEDLMSENPAKLDFKGTPARQEGFIKINLDVPGSVASQLQKKFGDRLPATISALLDVISGPKFLMLGEDDIKRLTDQIGQEVKSSSLLVGKIFEYKQKIDEDAATIKTLRTSLQSRIARGGAAITDATMVLELGDDLAAKVTEKAESKGMSPDEYVRTAATLAVEGDWV